LVFHRVSWLKKRLMRAAALGEMGRCGQEIFGEISGSGSQPRMLLQRHIASHNRFQPLDTVSMCVDACHTPDKVVSMHPSPVLTEQKHCFFAMRWV
jgi:hypothetical protein